MHRFLLMNEELFLEFGFNKMKEGLKNVIIKVIKN